MTRESNPRETYGVTEIPAKLDISGRPRKPNPHEGMVEALISTMHTKLGVPVGKSNGARTITVPVSEVDENLKHLYRAARNSKPPVTVATQVGKPDGDSVVITFWTKAKVTRTRPKAG